VSIPRSIMQAIIDLKRALGNHDMNPPVSMEFPDTTYDMLMNGMADAYGMSRTKFDQQALHGCGVDICGVKIKRAL